MQQTCAGALLDDRDEELKSNAETLSKALHEALDSEGDEVEDEWECSLDVEGETVPASGPIDRKFVGWVSQFCNKNVWGGLVESSITDTRKALEDFDGPRTAYLRPDALIRRKGSDYDMLQLLKGWDEDLAATGKAPGNLLDLWDRVRALREELLNSLSELTHFPLEWFDGNEDVRKATEEYLKVAGDLFRGVSQTYGAMHQENPDWARLTLDGLLSLDVVQVKVTDPEGRRSSGLFCFQRIPFIFGDICG